MLIELLSRARAVVYLQAAMQKAFAADGKLASDALEIEAGTLELDLADTDLPRC